MVNTCIAAIMGTTLLRLRRPREHHEHPGDNRLDGGPLKKLAERPRLSGVNCRWLCVLALSRYRDPHAGEDRRAGYTINDLDPPTPR